MNTKTFNTKEEFLKDTIEYYSANPIERRCKSISNGCHYSPKNAEKPNSEGCAIGRFMSEENALLADIEGECGTSVNHIEKDLIPNWMLQFPILFLKSVQILHDENVNWDANGLTYTGKLTVDNIIQTYKLDMSI